METGPAGRGAELLRRMNELWEEHDLLYRSLNRPMLYWLFRMREHHAIVERMVRIRSRIRALQRELEQIQR